MKFFSVALVGLSAAAAVAAPVEQSTNMVARDAEIFERGAGTTVCCPKGKKAGCSVPPKDSAPPADTDVYSCSFNGQIGLVNLFLCDFLNNLSINIPVIVTVPINILS